MNKVSVIIPVFNTEKYLNKCFESIINQTYKNLEIVIVNDGSTDSSEIIILDYLKKYKNIKYIKQKNKGLGPARNAGITVSTGEYICFVDSDDWIENDAIEKEIKAITEQKADVLIFNMRDVFEMGNIKEYDCVNFIIPFQKSPSACNKMYKKTAINGINFTNTWYEDLPFTFKVITNSKKTSILNDCLYNCNVRKDSITNNNNSLKNLDIIDCLNDINNYIKLNNIKYGKDYFEFIIIKEILCGSISRVSVQKCNNKKYVISILQKYVKNNVNKYYKTYFFNLLTAKQKIICFINYHNLFFINKLLYSIKKFILFF